MPASLDITRRFNGMSTHAKFGLKTLVGVYENRDLYLYNPDTIVGLLGLTKTEARGIIQELERNNFILKTNGGFRLNRQRADTLITMGILDRQDALPPMGPKNKSKRSVMESKNPGAHWDEMRVDQKQSDAGSLGWDLSIAKKKWNELTPEQQSVYEKHYAEENPDYIVTEEDINYMRKYGIEEVDTFKDPESLSRDDFEVTVDEPDKNTRFRVMEIIDMSAAGRVIDPPMWSISDTKTGRLYLVAQEGLRFKDPDASAYIGLKQLEFLKKHPQFVLGVFSDSEQGISKARAHGSRFFDTNVNNSAIPGYLPHRVGKKFWVLQSATNGSFSVLKRGKLPSLTLDKNKVVDLTHDEAIAVFVASESKWEDDQPVDDLKVEKTYDDNVDIDTTIDAFFKFNMGQ